MLTLPHQFQAGFNVGNDDAFDGRNPKQPPNMYETLQRTGYLPYQLASLQICPQKHFRKQSATDGTKPDLNIGFQDLALTGVGFLPSAVCCNWDPITSGRNSSLNFGPTNALGIQDFCCTLRILGMWAPVLRPSNGCQ